MARFMVWLPPRFIEAEDRKAAARQAIKDAVSTYHGYVWTQPLDRSNDRDQRQQTRVMLDDLVEMVSVPKLKGA